MFFNRGLFSSVCEDLFRENICHGFTDLHGVGSKKIGAIRGE